MTVDVELFLWLWVISTVLYVPLSSLSFSTTLDRYGYSYLFLYCSYNVMLECWQEFPNDRPDFARLQHDLGYILEQCGVNIRSSVPPTPLNQQPVQISSDYEMAIVPPSDDISMQTTTAGYGVSLRSQLSSCNNTGSDDTSGCPIGEYIDDRYIFSLIQMCYITRCCWGSHCDGNFGWKRCTEDGRQHLTKIIKPLFFFKSLQSSHKCILQHGINPSSHFSFIMAHKICQGVCLQFDIN